MRYLFLVMMFFMIQSHAFSQPETYGLHLFFNEKEFVDELTLFHNPVGPITGKMNVPNDFAGPLDNLIVSEKIISFDLFVPKNPSRPEDLTFHYEGQFFDSSRKQIIGYVTLKGESNFIASFTAFLRG